MSRQSLERAKSQRNRIAALLRRLDDATLERLERRGWYVPLADGYPAGGDGAGGSSEVSRPTEQASIRRIDEPPADPVAETLLNVFGALSEAAGVLGRVDRWLDHLAVDGERAVVRAAVKEGDCSCCERTVTGTPNDRMRSGFCHACHQAWRRWQEEHPDPSGDPGARRIEFVRERRAMLAEREERAG